MAAGPGSFLWAAAYSSFSSPPNFLTMFSSTQGAAANATPKRNGTASRATFAPTKIEAMPAWQRGFATKFRDEWTPDYLLPWSVFSGGPPPEQTS